MLEGMHISNDVEDILVGEISKGRHFTKRITQLVGYIFGRGAGLLLTGKSAFFMMSL